MNNKYFLNPAGSENWIPAGTNKSNAQHAAKEHALLNKRSVSLFRKVGNDLIYYGIAEFPYYLRELELDLRDITWNGIK